MVYWFTLLDTNSEISNILLNVASSHNGNLQYQK